MAHLQDVGSQFESIAEHMESTNSIRERIRDAVTKLEHVTRQMHSELLSVHGAALDSENAIVVRTLSHLPDLARCFQDIASIVGERPGEYYRFNDHWKQQASTVSFLLAFSHWLRTAQLLSHAEVEQALQMRHDVFGIDLEDYLIGICSLSNELPRYAINRVTKGDYSCPQRVSSFLNQLFAAFRKLNLRNDVLRKRYDGIKYDVKKVEEVLYDVQIRGLSAQQHQQTPAA